MDGEVGRFGTSDARIALSFNTSSQATQSIVGKRAACNHVAAGWWDVRITATALVVEFGGQGRYDLVFVKRALADGAWHDVQVARTATKVDVTVDGVTTSVVSSNGPSNIDNPAIKMAVSASPCIGVDGTKAFTGRIDNLVIGDVPPAPAVVATYRATGNALDSTSTHHGAWSAAALYAAGRSGAPGDRSFELDGTKAIVMDGEVGRFDTSDARIALSFNTSSKATQSIVGKRAFCNHVAAGWWDVRITATALVVEFGGQRRYDLVVVDRPLADGAWHDVEIIRSATRVDVTVDGVTTSVPSAAAAPTSPTPTSRWPISAARASASTARRRSWDASTTSSSGAARRPCS